MERITIPFKDCEEWRCAVGVPNTGGHRHDSQFEIVKTCSLKKQHLSRGSESPFILHTYYVTTILEDRINKVIEKLDKKDLQLKIAEWTISRLAKEKKEMEDKYEDIFDNLYKRLQYLELKVVSNLDELD